MRREEELIELFRSHGHSWSQRELLSQALSHPSYTHEYNSLCSSPSEFIPHNERLEYLGDSILGALVSSELFRLYPHLEEGDLSKARMGIVNGRRLAELAKERLNLHEFLKLGKGERLHMASLQEGPLSDAFEALVGAMYLDLQGDMEKLKKFLFSLVPDLLFFELKGQDPKSRLQEIFMKTKRPLPFYKTLSLSEEVGPFEVALMIDGKEVTRVTDSSKKKAHQILAAKALEILNM